MDVSIRNAAAEDWPDIERIYRQGILGGNATFEEEVPDREAWDRAHCTSPRLVARSGEKIVGWAALSPVSSRASYRGVAEVSVYVDSGMAGRGVGRALLRELVSASENAGFWTLQASIFPENAASLRIHDQCGFRVVGRRERIGVQRGRWRDVLLLERRSSLT